MKLPRDPSDSLAVLLSDEFDSTETVPQRLRRIAEIAPNHLAVQASDARYTYRELNETANGIAHLILDAAPMAKESSSILSKVLVF